MKEEKGVKYDTELNADDLKELANKFKAVYKEALDFVVDFAVEVPIYQRQEGTFMSTARIKGETIPKDLTTYYTLAEEIEKLQLK